MALTKEEITRKLLHLFALIMPIGLFYFPKWWGDGFYWVSVGLLAFFVCGSIVVETLRFRVPAVQKVFYVCFGHMLRKEESAKVTGSTFVVGAALICSILFINHRHISFMVLTLFILGDAIAAIVGISIGRIKIGKKSLEGSAACFLLCMALFYALFAYLPGLLDVWGGKVHLPTAVAASLSVTIFELIPLKITPKLTINDNLAVPVITGGVILLMERAVIGL